MVFITNDYICKTVLPFSCVDPFPFSVDPAIGVESTRFSANKELQNKII